MSEEKKATIVDGAYHPHLRRPSTADHEIVSLVKSYLHSEGWKVEFRTDSSLMESVQRGELSRVYIYPHAWMTFSAHHFNNGHPNAKIIVLGGEGVAPAGILYLQKPIRRQEFLVALKLFLGQ